MSLDITAVLAEIDDAPTVNLGLILLLTRVRYEVAPVAPELAAWLDRYAPELSDAVINNTPAQVPHEQRADKIAEEADGIDAGLNPS